jgi:hypothetical protein
MDTGMNLGQLLAEKRLSGNKRSRINPLDPYPPATNVGFEADSMCGLSE